MLFALKIRAPNTPIFADFVERSLTLQKYVNPVKSKSGTTYLQNDYQPAPLKNIVEFLITFLMMFGARG